ncbi:hypothetical protein P175DRAFT_0473722 [Aspergillus ochraceoroseus IBT 24754]|uniref:Tse2 ADP-ribosyltransferase toxin domain-containing protein n=3 Tax=Aspergillus subgen. Nidulantes TaxID=2720870 RepID=A0A0F8U292_9EURO|nr:uncharacterized protein P175DRAFT_0473722 [Aspergillus ochraceoroseus IBT 24754]KKK13673.1 hypothetical protein ARAM_006031 [Aspergillus rambellii]KKK24680.1 hypothetical protein AOCH_004910 [Aspergillus ochraceoroseus]PTU22560.1 hypothetical protein P175DRAFT_0473722 [Aspergillus ochraceoroseus IBT 24754]
MFRNLLRPISGASAHWQNRRGLSYVSSHSVFPATLYRFQVRPESPLFDKKFDRDDLEWEDGIEVANDGLVYPKISMDVSNGALFMPNTHLMQEFTRGSYDNYMEAVDNGQPAGRPGYLSISKGTAIPKSLTLYRERDSRFTLQPSQPMTLQALNETLTDFYSKFSTSTPPGEWLDKNPYHEAFFDNSEEWMDL